MDAPIWESIIRAVTLGVALFTAVCVVRLWLIHHRAKDPIRFLTGYLSFVTVTLAIDRVYVLYVGFLNDRDGTYARDIEPFVRSVGASLLILLLLGVGLIALFHIRHREPANGH
jgi:hypothetical protein